MQIIVEVLKITKSVTKEVNNDGLIIVPTEFLIISIMSTHTYLRFFVEYSIDDSRELPLDYRRGFVNLVKTALEIGSNHDNRELPAANIDSSPLCFAVRFDQKPQISGQMLIIGKNLRLYFSSPSLILGSVLYNGLLELNQFTVFSSKLINPRANYIKEDHIVKDTVMFKTLSPIVIRDHRRKERYVLPNEDGFTKSFKNALDEQWKRYHNATLDLESDDNIKVEILRFKKVVMTHYGGLVLGFTGNLKLVAVPDVLLFFYRSGLGYRKSNGFGMVEIDRC